MGEQGEVFVIGWRVRDRSHLVTDSAKRCLL